MHFAREVETYGPQQIAGFVNFAETASNPTKIGMLGEFATAGVTVDGPSADDRGYGIGTVGFMQVRRWRILRHVFLNKPKRDKAATPVCRPFLEVGLSKSNEALGFADSLVLDLGIGWATPETMQRRVKFT